jgi:hypothetical protein
MFMTGEEVTPLRNLTPISAWQIFQEHPITRAWLQDATGRLEILNHVTRHPVGGIYNIARVKRYL